MQLGNGNRKRDVFGSLSPDEQQSFFKQLDFACKAAGLCNTDLTRFDGLRDAMMEDAPLWQVLSSGQVVLSAKTFPDLTATPAWDRGDGDPFPWLRELEAYVPVIREELRAVRENQLPDDYCLGPENVRAMERLAGLTDTERSIYVPGFDSRPTSGYCHLVLMNNDERKQVAELFPRTMAALETCGVPMGARLIAFGKQLSHSALHWHSDGRNFVLTAHLPLSGPSRRSGERTPPLGSANGSSPFPAASMREGASGMVLWPLPQPSVEPPSLWSRIRTSIGEGSLAQWLMGQSRRLTPSFLRAGRAPVQGDHARAVSRSWSGGQLGREVPAGGSVFDTTFMHSAYNDGDEAADILFIDFFHPELTQSEQIAIRCLQKLLRDHGEAQEQGV